MVVSFGISLSLSIRISIMADRSTLCIEFLYLLMIKNTLDDKKQQEQMIREAQRSPLMSETDWWEQTTNNKQSWQMNVRCCSVSGG